MKSTDMKPKRIKKNFFILIIFIFIIYEIRQLHGKYGQLFYIQTYLPQPNIGVQERKEITTQDTKTSPERANTPRILCLITTSPKYHATRAVHVAATWARHCIRAIFMTSELDESLPDSFVISEASGYHDLWDKVSQGFKMVYDQELLTSYDWVLKVDDDTFVFMDNLVTALESYDPNDLIAVGHKLFTWESHKIYLNGGAGYVLSKAAVRQFVSKGLIEKECEKNVELGTGEDVNMALCLTYLGVTLLEFRDEDGRSQFHIYPPQQEIDPRQAYSWGHLWLKLISVYPYPFGFETLTNHPISFHYVDAETMYLVYYLTYVINPDRGKYIDTNNDH